MEGCELDDDFDYAVIKVKDCQDLSFQVKHKIYQIDNYNKGLSQKNITKLQKEKDDLLAKQDEIYGCQIDPTTGEVILEDNQ